jgi:hypothetical protein
VNTSPPEIREGAVNLAAEDLRVRAGFRIVDGELLAGGPVELEFFVESVGERPLQLAVSGDRMRQRPGQFDFVAIFEGSPLEDPMAAMAYMGGPVGVVQVSAGNPWHQPLVLNQFVCLDETPGRLAPGARGRLDLSCRRPLALAATESAALSPHEAPDAAIDLAFYLRRDDEALIALAERLVQEVMQGPLASRERPLALLLSMRAAAHAQIEALTRHHDPSVANRARQVLATPG